MIYYLDEILSLLMSESFDVKIIITFTDLQRNSYNKEDIEKFHIEDHLERIHMQYKNDMVILIYDNMNLKKEKIFKDIYNEIRSNNKYIKYFASLFDSLLFDYSYDNIFLQISDFIGGCFSGVLRSSLNMKKNNYRESNIFFFKYIYDKLNKNPTNEIWGVGLKETPTDTSYRREIKNLFNKIKERYNL